MTAEIGILNRSAIALAADSAVTIQTFNGQKIYNTVNKLFSLTKVHPVGIMIYGSAELNSVPWETLIKLYRQQLGARSFATVAGYAADFIDFVERRSNKILSEGEADYVYTRVTHLIAYARDRFLGEIEQRYQEGWKPGIAKTDKILSRILTDEVRNFQRSKKLPGFSRPSPGKIFARHKKVIAVAIKSAFGEKYRLGPRHIRLIHSLISDLFTRDIFKPEFTSGIVVAGFGERQHYPAVLEFHVDGFIAGKLKYRNRRATGISAENAGIILPFAQSEMVNTLM